MFVEVPSSLVGCPSAVVRATTHVLVRATAVLVVWVTVPAVLVTVPDIRPIRDVVPNLRVYFNHYGSFIETGHKALAQSFILP